MIKGITNVVYRIRRCNPPHKRLVIHFNHLKPYRGKQHPDLLPTLTPASTPVHPQSSSPSGVHPQSPSPSEQALLMPETVEHSVDEHSASDDSEQAGANPGSDEHAGESDDVPAGANPGSADSEDTAHTSPPPEVYTATTPSRPIWSLYLSLIFNRARGLCLLRGGVV